ncbi:DPP IV N-terminal domain-containing protein [Fulvivirgaceae bacterium LMO-SS25]
MKSSWKSNLGISLALLFCFTLTDVLAQDKANFKAAEKFKPENLRKMSGSLSVYPNWIKDKEEFWYSYQNTEGRNWYMVNAANRTKNLLFDQDYMAGKLSESMNRAFNAKDLDLKEFKYDVDRGLFTFHVDSIGFTYNISNRTLVKEDSIKKREERITWANYSPDSTWIAFAKNHNLYLMKAGDADSVEYQLTTDGEKWYSYNANDGDTTTTKRLRPGVSWFKDSKKLYSKRQDRRKVDDLWVINSTSRGRPELETYKYPMPGDKNVPQDELHIFDVESKKQIPVKAERWKDQSIGGAYFGAGGGIFTSLKESKYLWFIRRDRTWSKIDLCRVDTETGDVKILIEEVSKPYFNTRYANVGLINEGQEIIWFSERDGWGQLYLYDGEGNMKNKITNGYFVAGDIQKVDTVARTIYFEGYGLEPGVDPYYNMYYKVKFDGTGQKLLTSENATHSFNMSDKNNYFVDTYSTVNQVPKSVLRDKEGRVVLDLQESDISKLVEAGFKMPEPFTVKAADNVTDLYGVMWKPYDFDSTKTYPIVTYVYPGPQTEPVPKNFSLGRNEALAQLGFVVVAVGQRGGSPQRSRYYHTFGYDNMRDYPLEDNKYALEQLSNRHKFINISKVGIFGHSGGGFMSTAALLTYPDFYTAAVSSAGNHDNNMYNIWWGEVHHGVKEEVKKVKKKNDEGEEETVEEISFKSEIKTNAELAKNLKGHLLLVHGDMDNNVHPGNSIRVADALIKAGKRFDFMVMPGRRHGFGAYQEYFDKLMWYYFAEHLIGDYRTGVDLDLFEE